MLFIRESRAYHEMAPQWLHWAVAINMKWIIYGEGEPNWDAMEVYIYGA